MKSQTALFAAGLIVVVIVACGGDDGVATWTQEGSSMDPTVSHGEQVRIREYGSNVPERGDIVLYISLFQRSDTPERNFLKRVVGLPGETVEVRGQEVLIDGELLDEPYVHDPPRYTLALMTIPAGHYFLLPDKRNSNFEPALEPIPSENIVGYVVE